MYTKKTAEISTVCIEAWPKSLIAFHGLNLSQLLHLLSLEGFLFSVLDSGGFLKIFTFFPFPDDSLFFHHSFKFLNGLFQRFSLINTYVSYSNHLLQA